MTIENKVMEEINRGPIYIKALASLVNMKPKSLQAHVSSLRAKGLIVTADCPRDKRETIIYSAHYAKLAGIEQAESKHTVTPYNGLDEAILSGNIAKLMAGVAS
jgi:ribosomal protein L30E